MTTPAGLQGALDVLGQRHQRPGQDVGEDQVVGRVAAHPGVVQAAGVDEAGAGAVQPRRSRRRCAPRAGRCRCRPPRCGCRCAPRRWPARRCRADVEHARRSAGAFSSRSKASRQPTVVPWWPVPKAAPASMRRLTVFGGARPRSCAPIDEEAAGAHRRQAGQRHGQPVGVGQRLGDHAAAPGSRPARGDKRVGLVRRRSERRRSARRRWSSSSSRIE